MTILWLYLWLLSISQWPVRGIRYDHLSTSVRGIPLNCGMCCAACSPLGALTYLSGEIPSWWSSDKYQAGLFQAPFCGPALRKCLVVYKSFHIIFLQGEKFHDLPSWIFQQERSQDWIVIINFILAQSSPFDNLQGTFFLWRCFCIVYPSNCLHGCVCRVRREECGYPRWVESMWWKACRHQQLSF